MAPDAKITRLADAIAKISKYSGKYAPYLASLMYERGIDTRLRQVHFLTQVAHESGEFRLVEEGLSYGPDAIRKNFRKYFILDNGAWNEALIAKYTHNPIEFANYVYGNRMGNAGRPGAGYKHRGMGLMQSTGYDNQLAYSMWKYGDDRVIRNPEMLKELEDAAGSAVYYWITNRINKWADKDDLLACGRAVNLGNPMSSRTPNGQEHRTKMYNLISKLIPEAA